MDALWLALNVMKISLYHVLHILVHPHASTSDFLVPDFSVFFLSGFLLASKRFATVFEFIDVLKLDTFLPHEVGTMCTVWRPPVGRFFLYCCLWWPVLSETTVWLLCIFGLHLYIVSQPFINQNPAFCLFFSWLYTNPHISIRVTEGGCWCTPGCCGSLATYSHKTGHANFRFQIYSFYLVVGHCCTLLTFWFDESDKTLNLMVNFSYMISWLGTLQ